MNLWIHNNLLIEIIICLIITALLSIQIVSYNIYYLIFGKSA